MTHAGIQYALVENTRMACATEVHSDATTKDKETQQKSSHDSLSCSLMHHYTIHASTSFCAEYPPRNHLSSSVGLLPLVSGTYTRVKRSAPDSQPTKGMKE